MGSDDRVSPDDITDEECEAAIPARREWLAAQNRLRDERVRACERERIARILTARSLLFNETTHGAFGRGWGDAVDHLLAAIRGGDER